LTAADLLELAARDGVCITRASSGTLKASGPREALARWLPELKAMKPTILASVNDGERHCFACGQPARFGFGVHLRRGLEGRLTCAAHRPQGEGHA
jgi:hypothetical protein